MSFAVHFLRRMITLSECVELDEHSKREIESMAVDNGDWKERRLDELMEEIARMDLSEIAGSLGAVYNNGILSMKYMGRDIHFDKKEFNEEIDMWDKLIFLMYVKHAGHARLSGQWVAFRDLKGGMIRARGFNDACELSLAQMFEHNKDRCIKKLRKLGATQVDGFATEFSYILHPLPMIPLLILVWPADEVFQTDCKILFDSTATEFLDVEALLYMGIALIRTADN